MKTGKRKRPEIDANGYRWSQPPYPYTAIVPEQVEIAKQFLAQCEVAERFGLGSYGLKHDIEKAMGHYVTNGATITAAIELGIRCEPAFRSRYVLLPECGVIENSEPLNGFVYVTRASVERVYHEMRRARRISSQARPSEVV